MRDLVPDEADEARGREAPSCVSVFRVEQPGDSRLPEREHRRDEVRDDEVPGERAPLAEAQEERGAEGERRRSVADVVHPGRRVARRCDRDERRLLERGRPEHEQAPGGGHAVAGADDRLVDEAVRVGARWTYYRDRTFVNDVHNSDVAETGPRRQGGAGRSGDRAPRAPDRLGGGSCRAPVTSITARDLRARRASPTASSTTTSRTRASCSWTALLRRFDELLDDFEASLPTPGSGSVEANVRAFAEALFRFDVDGFPLFTKLLGDPPLLRRFLVETHRRPLYTERVRSPSSTTSPEAPPGRITKMDPEATADLLIGGSPSSPSPPLPAAGPRLAVFPPSSTYALKGIAR